MSGSFEKAVKGGTKIKLAPPKAKYVENILIATHAGESGVAEIFRTLQHRLRDSTWTIVFKALIIVHLMIREGEPNVTLKFVADSPSKLAISNFSDGTSKEYSMASARGPTEIQVQGTNIRHYYTYLLSRAKAYKDTRIDWVREGTSRLKRQSVDKGLLRETEAVQSQISKLLQCDLLGTDAENEITICAFRLLTMDLLVLYGVMNEGTINVLEHYFEMSKYDAERALSIYKTFTKQTNLVVEFLSTARQYENATRLEIPKLKHAPTSLTSSLQEYLNDPDFEINRRQYLAQQEAKKGGKGTSNGAATAKNNFTKSAVNSGGTTMEVSESKTVQTLPPKQETKGPAPDLIDFFGSIEQNQQTMASAPQQPQQQQVPNFGMGQHYQQQQQLQQTGVVPQQLASYFSFEQNGQPQQTQNVTGSTNPFGQPQQQPQQQPVQQDFAGTGFSGYAQQPFNQQPDPFSTISQSFSSQLPQTQQQQQQQQSFNTGQPQNNSGQQPFGTQKQPVFSQQPQQPMVTGTNPFRQSTMPQATGASQSAFSIPTSPQSYQTTGSNPFARNISNQHTSQSQNSPFAAQQGSPFTSPPPQEPQGIPFNSPPQSQQQQQQQQQNASQPMTPMRTGTNPFAPNRSVTMPVSQLQPTTSPLVPTQTGSTNPFRKSEFLNQQTGQGWQAGQGTIGGFEQLPTMPVFPRLGQPQQGQQQGTWP